jgi:hypothetical protein
MKRIIITLTLAVFIAFNSNGQDTIIDYNKFTAIDMASFKGVNFTPFGAGTLSNIVSNASLSSAMKAGENAKVELKYTSARWLTLGLSTDQKLGKNDKESIPFDFLDGISSGTTVKFNLQKMFWKPLNGAAVRKIQNAARSYATAKNIDARVVTLYQLQKDPAFAGDLSGIHLKTPIFINIETGFTKSSFSYATDSFTLSKQEEIHLAPLAKVNFGWAFSVRSVLGLSYSYSVSYESADEFTFNSPFGTSSNQYSKTVSFGKPTRKEDNKLNIEYRSNIIKSNGVSLGIAPAISYGLSSKGVAMILPVYFINSKDSTGKPTGLQGGIRFGYSTSTEKNKATGFKDGFAAQIIITAPFSVFENFKD